MDLKETDIAALGGTPMDLPVKPIGYIESVFKFKNGTPRQAGVCLSARAKLTITKDVFNNPKHSLEGLESFSHVWVVFWFHKNNNAYSKAKVKPPRLNGKKVGLFSTRSPYRPNPIGLTMAKIEAVQSATLLLSGIDMLDGTPVLDIKPFIPQYDTPSLKVGTEEIDSSFSEMCNPINIGSDSCEINAIDMETDTHSSGSGVELVGKDRINPCFAPPISHSADSPTCIDPDRVGIGCSGDIHIDNENTPTGGLFGKTVTAPTNYSLPARITISEEANCDDALTSDSISPLDDLTKAVTNIAKCRDDVTCLPDKPSIATQYNYSLEDEGNSVKDYNSASNVEHSGVSAVRNWEPSPDIADWISNPPISKLSVRFTSNAEQQLNSFSSGNCETKFQLSLFKSALEAKEAITSILNADPRSTYRRKHCEDRLYFFTLDVLHITCWFDNCCAEVVRVKPIVDVTKLAPSIT